MNLLPSAGLVAVAAWRPTSHKCSFSTDAWLSSSGSSSAKARRPNPFVVMWLCSQMPTRWGPQEEAMRFKTKNDASRAAGIFRISGEWSVEEAEPL